MTRGVLTLMLLGVLGLVAAGCGGGGGEDGQSEAAGEAVATAGGEDGGVDRYTVRGVISKLPTIDSPDPSVYIRHAPIPGYKNEDGEVVGMAAMTMPFPVAEGVSTEGLQVGDPVEFTFTMRWKPTGHYEIVAIDELPAGTEIDFDAPMHGHDGHDHDGHDHDGHSH